MENSTVKDPGIITYPPHDLAWQAVSRCLAATVLLLTVLAVSPESLAQSSDDVRAGARNFGDITSLTGPRFPRGNLNGQGDQVDYYRFTLTAAKRVGLGLRQQDADADMFLEDSDGDELYSSTASGTDNEVIDETLLAGTYYVRVESQEAGVNAYVFRYGVSVPDAGVNADDTRTGATDFGDITSLTGPRFPRGTLDGDGDQVDYYRFTLTEAKRVDLGLRQQDADADMFLEDSDGNEIYDSTVSGTDNEVIAGTLLAGTYYVRVESQETGVNTYVFRYGVSVPDAGELTAPQEQQGTLEIVSEPDVYDTSRVQGTLDTVSEPDGEDFPADMSTSGRVLVGGTARGEIGSEYDRDWFAVDLVAGRTYTIDLKGSPTDDGTLSDPFLYGIHDPRGTRIVNTSDDDMGIGRNSRRAFTATETGTHYIDAGAFVFRQGTYEVEVSEGPPIWVFDAMASESSSTDIEMLFRVRLQRVSSEPVTVDYATADGTAKAGEDYTATSGTLTFAPGEIEKTVAVTIIYDTVDDRGERFTLVLSNPSGGALGDPEATGTIGYRYRTW